MVQISPEHAARCIYAEEIDDRPLTSRRHRKILTPPPSQAEGQKEEEILSSENLKLYYPKESDSVVSLFGLGEKKFVKAVDDSGAGGGRSVPRRGRFLG